MNATTRRRRGRRLAGLGVALLLTAVGVLALVGPGGSGPIGTVATWVSSDTFRGAMVALGSAALVAGLAAGLLALGVATLRGYSWGPARVAAAWALGRPTERVGRTAAAAAHLLLSVVVLFVLGALALGGSILLAVFLPSPVSMLGGTSVALGGLLLVTVAVGWWLLTSRWLPAVTRETDVAPGPLRRQAAVVVATYAVVAAVTYPVVLFVTMMLVFFR
jgi:hypothetical protein